MSFIMIDQRSSRHNAAPVLRASTMVRSPRRVRRLAVCLFIALMAAVGALGTLPWMQTSRGSGRVIGYFPYERPQTVESRIKGRVVRLGKDVDGKDIVEGSRVRSGDLILEIEDNDPDKATRLQEKLTAAEAKVRFAEEKAHFFEEQIEEWKQYQVAVVESGEKAVEMSREKIAATKQDLAAAEADKWQLDLDSDRQTALAQKGAAAGSKAQEAKAKYDKAVAKVEAAKNYIKAAQAELSAKEADLKSKTREATAKVHQAEAYVREAQGAVEISKKELADVKLDVAQFNQREVRATRDGIILSLNAYPGVDMLKEGDPLFTIVPDTAERAVELLIDGNDVPLVTVGAAVRLQFEGWPTIQISGWPEASLWTFAGEVVLIDPALTREGKCRLLVREVPNLPPETTGFSQEELVHRGWRWPPQEQLRQNSRANGWVLLTRVRLGYELWRQMNGFPPITTATDGKEEGKGGKDVKKVKLPK
jgi:adhesin transport system membrane fusion protein